MLEPRYASSHGLQFTERGRDAGSRGVRGGREDSTILGRTVAQLQKESEATLALEAETAQVNQQLALQVAALQRGFNALADAVLEELEAVRDESQRWPAERSSWVNAMSNLKDDMQKKLDQMEARHEESQLALDKAWQENQQLRAENDMLHHRLSDLEAKSNELSRHMDQVKRGVSSMQSSAGDIKDSLSNLAAKVEAREAIQRTIGRTIADLEARVKDDLSRLRDDATNTCRALQADAETAAGDLEALRTWCKQLDTSHRAHVADTSQRISHLEAGPDLAPMLAAIQQLEDRVASSSRAHEAATARLEAGLGRVNGDAAENAARLARVESSLQAVRRSLREHHDALIRSAAVFAEALNISSPLSEVSLAASLSPGLPAGGGSGNPSTTAYHVPAYGSVRRPQSQPGSAYAPHRAGSPR